MVPFRPLASAGAATPCRCAAGPRPRWAGGPALERGSCPSQLGGTAAPRFGSGAARCRPSLGGGAAQGGGGPRPAGTLAARLASAFALRAPRTCRAGGSASPGAAGRLPALPAAGDRPAALPPAAPPWARQAPPAARSRARAGGGARGSGVGFGTRHLPQGKKQVDGFRHTQAAAGSLFSSAQVPCRGLGVPVRRRGRCGHLCARSGVPLGAFRHLPPENYFGRAVPSQYKPRGDITGNKCV
ncbi:translation initiation factor IF-2-like [Jatropha curcas]|uniref:translation initiation factor IF-2-like n=1 Tax=Jatropha curcas TaxID=180498 RepID=UPI0018938FF9|nr:translation initiation factor IF-2-like [Jatropha curcas]